MTDRDLRFWLMGGLIAALSMATADAALITNTWAALGSGKWETGADWDHGVPSLTYSLISLRPVGGLSAGATIDVDTVINHVSTGCLTVSNLTVAGGPPIFSTTATLLLTNANNTAGNIGLTIVNALNINARGNVIITNSRLHVGSPAPFFDDGLFVNGYLLLNTGELVTSNCFAFVGNAGNGTMTVQDGQWHAGYVGVGNGGQGTLNIAGGTTRITPYLSLGHTEGTAMTNTGTGTVLMTGGELITTNTSIVLVEVVIGSPGVGYMTISNGFWYSSDVIVGGTLTIAGGTALLSSGNYGNLFIGLRTNGTVLMTGGELIVTNDYTRTWIGFATKYANTVAQMTVSNGTWRAKSVWVTWRDEADPDPTGEAGSGMLTIAGGLSLISSNLTLGNSVCSGIATVEMNGGSVFVTNATGDAVLDVHSGTFTLRGGSLVVDKLVLGHCGHFIRAGGTLTVASVSLSPYDDADGDGLPNWWEQVNGYDVFDPTTGVDDSDRDGLDNFVEYSLRTDPHDPADPLHITGIARENDDIRVTWNYVPVPGSSFAQCVLEAGPTVTGAWANVSAPITLPYGFFTVSETNLVDPGAMTNFPTRFYRVRWVP